MATHTSSRCPQCSPGPIDLFFSVGIVFRLELISDSNIIMYRTIYLVLDSVYTLEAENEYPCFIDLLSVK